jgi:hypothetical protein
VKEVSKILFSIFIALILVISSGTTSAKEPKSKFYDFSEQLIDGERKKPTTLFMDARQKVKFDRLLKLKKSFLPRLFKTAKEKVFK